METISLHPQQAWKAFARCKRIGRYVLGMVLCSQSTKLTTSVAVAMIDWIDPVKDKE
jgi:hypothetical protein